MAVEKWRRRAVFATSVGIKNAGGSGGNRSIQGFINNSNGGTITSGVAAGTLCLTLDGTSVAGTQALLDLTAHRLRIPSAGRAIGGVTIGWGTAAATQNGSAGDIVTGYDGASAYLGINIGGTLHVLQWAIAGSTVYANPYAVGVA